MSWHYVVLGSAGGLAFGGGALAVMISQMKKRDAARAQAAAQAAAADQPMLQAGSNHLQQGHSFTHGQTQSATRRAASKHAFDQADVGSHATGPGQANSEKISDSGMSAAEQMKGQSCGQGNEDFEAGRISSQKGAAIFTEKIDRRNYNSREHKAASGGQHYHKGRQDESTISWTDILFQQGAQTDMETNKPSDASLHNHNTSSNLHRNESASAERHSSEGTGEHARAEREQDVRIGPEEIFSVALSCMLLIGIIVGSNLKTYMILMGKGRAQHSADTWEKGFARFLKSRGINFNSREGPGRDESAEAREYQRKVDAYWANFNEKMSRMDTDHDEFVKRWGQEQHARARAAGMRVGGNKEVSLSLKVLGLQRKGLDEKKLREAYLQAAQKWHPDKHPEDQRVFAGEKFKEVGRAYAYLKKKLSDL